MLGDGDQLLVVRIADMHEHESRIWGRSAQITGRRRIVYETRQGHRILPCEVSRVQFHGEIVFGGSLHDVPEQMVFKGLLFFARKRLFFQLLLERRLDFFRWNLGVVNTSNVSVLGFGGHSKASVLGEPPIDDLVPIR